MPPPKPSCQPLAGRGAFNAHTSVFAGKVPTILRTIRYHHGRFTKDVVGLCPFV